MVYTIQLGVDLRHTFYQISHCLTSLRPCGKEGHHPPLGFIAHIWFVKVAHYSAGLYVNLGICMFLKCIEGVILYLASTGKVSSCSSHLNLVLSFSAFLITLYWFCDNMRRVIIPRHEEDSYPSPLLFLMQTCCLEIWSKILT